MTEVAGRVERAPEQPRRSVRSHVRAPLLVATARLRARPGRALLAALGVAISTAMLAAAFGASVTARDRAVQRALDRLPAADRSFRVDAFGLPPGLTYAQADGQVRAQLVRLGPGTPLRGTFFRELRIDGELVQLAGLDGIDRLVALRSGRLPRVCSPARCEVLQVGGRDAITRLDEGGIHLVRVGTAELPDRAVFGASIDTEQEGGDRPTLLLASGARSFESLPAFDGLYRTYAWIAPLDPRSVHVWQIEGVLARETQVQAALARVGDEYELSGPDQALADVRAEGRVAAQRMLLIGGEASALLLGFALITAMGLRRGLANERRRLLQRGARRTQVWLAESVEIVSTTLAGAVAGAAAGVVVIVLVADAAGLPGGAVLAHSLTWTAVGALAGLWLAASATVYAGTRLRDPDATGGRRVRLVDVAAIGAAAAVAFGLARGGLDAQALQSGGDRGLLLALPLLVSFVAAVIAVRLLAPLTRLAERAARDGPVAARLALLALSRAPVRTTATAAFLLVSLGLGLFAASWRATIDRGARDQAAFAVPLDFTVTEGGQLVLPLDAAPVSRYEAIAPGVRAYPVLRRSADVAGVGTSVLSPTVLGLDPAAVQGVRWRSDFSAVAPRELARRIDLGPIARRGLAVPRGTRRLTLDVDVRGVPVQVQLVVRDEGGRTRTLLLGERAAGRWRLATTVPASVRQVVGLEISLATAETLGVTHRATGATVAEEAAGDARLGPLRADGAGGAATIVTTWRGLLARAGLHLTPGPRPILAYAFTQGQTMLLRVRQPTDGRVLPVVVSPQVARSAGPGGSLVLDFQGVRVPARVVAVARRFPDAEQQGEGFVVADETWLASALDADAPGTGSPDELWLTAPAGAERKVAQALQRPPFASLVVDSRGALQRSLAADPLARGISLSLAAAAIAALALAVFGLWVAILSELRDERGELFDLEAQGVAPATLRRQLQLRSAALVGLGILGGTALGLALSKLVVAVVRVSGTTAQPDPPLRLDVSWPVVGVGVGAVALALALLVELTSRRSFRGDNPERASWSLE